MNMFAVLLAAIWTQTLADDELMLVHVIWRDGDHVPVRVCVNDNNTWTEPPGQLTAKGMKQHLDLGNLLYSRYTDKFLIDEKYVSRQIYIRSTDVNRTIASATSNQIGMFFNRTEQQPGVDFPEGAKWPNGVVPVPVHMIEENIDHIGNPDADCARTTTLLGMLKESETFKTFLRDNKELIESIKTKCGDSDFDILNADYIADAQRIEELQNETTLLTTEEYKVLLKAAKLKNGFGGPTMHVIDLSTELPKARSGTLLWDIIDRIGLKVFCDNETNLMKKECAWIKDFKYYAYSGMEKTVDSLLETIGVSDYSAVDAYALVIELYQTANGEMIKTFSINTVADGLKPLGTGACEGMESCTLTKFREYALKYNPVDIKKFCEGPRSAETKPLRLELPKMEPLPADDQKDELIFLQTIWRHGDRYPKKVCKNDNNTDATWRKGFGQLSYIGMEQHRFLGSLIYEAYAKKIPFLSATYEAKEIYVRSTDVNRTVTSAMANMIGLTYNRGIQAGVLPETTDWPAGFIPIPIHTVADETDYIGDPHAACQRKSDLVAISMRTPEIIQAIEDSAEFVRNLSAICGQELGFLDLSSPVDTWEVEDVYNRTKIFTREEYEKMRELSDIGENVWNGLLNTTEYEGYNLRVELARLSGGSILYDLIYHMLLKVHCLNNTDQPECSWMKGLKYYAYSARGTTMNALLAALEAKEVFPNGIPPFAAAIIFELWKTSKGQFEVLIRFRAYPEDSDLVDITANVDGCPATGRCPMEQFLARSEKFNPGKIEELCSKRAEAPTVSTAQTDETPLVTTPWPSTSAPVTSTTSSGAPPIVITPRTSAASQTWASSSTTNVLISFIGLLMAVKMS